MIDKRLLKEIPEVKSIVVKQVALQWMGLCLNILITALLCYLFYTLLTSYVHTKLFITLIITMCVLVCLRAYILKQSVRLQSKNMSIVKKSLRSRLFSHILSLPSYQDHVSTAELVQLSVEGINQLETYSGLYLPQFFYSLLAPLTLFIIISPADIKTASVLFICVPLIPISIICVQKLAKRLLTKYWTSYTTLGDSFLENLQGLTTLKIYQSDDYKHRQMNKEAENFRKITMRVLIMQLNSISIMDIVAYGGAGLGSYMAISQYINNHISLYTALFIILMSFEFFIPLRQLGSFFHIAMNGIAASDKIFTILELPLIEKTSSIDSSVSHISIENLSFAYANDNVLTDINMNINKNQWVSIVGESGSGKSTIAKLIMGYHSHYQGNIKVNNINRNNIEDESFNHKVSYIHNDPMIFKGTLRENLDFKNDYTDNQLWYVLNQVGISEYFKYQQGLDTLLLEEGSNLSKGQKQRINIARALLKDSEVYIFDEATSAVDVETEEQIIKIIEQLSSNKTIIYITHRLSTVKNSDYIYVLENGLLKEEGSYTELNRQKGLFYKMNEIQKELEEYHEQI